MKKLIQGIVDFRRARREGYAGTFAKLALGQQPDALFIACSDSRVAVNVFASADPGDLFVLRNVGNMIPPWGDPGGTAAAAAIEYALEILKVRDVVICGHSDCGAMRARRQGLSSLPAGPVRDWLALAGGTEAPAADADEDSRRNVLLQLERLKGYPSVARAIEERSLGLHGLWFDIRRVDVLYREPEAGNWAVVDEAEGGRILARLEGR
ncbi:MAG: carbonic anhydrase [Elusimicrobia bacterium]|nr:carbonic anhydrase [Elusimicrobiota bacterium]